MEHLDTTSTHYWLHKYKSKVELNGVWTNINGYNQIQEILCNTLLTHHESYITVYIYIYSLKCLRMHVYNLFLWIHVWCDSLRKCICYPRCIKQAEGEERREKKRERGVLWYNKVIREYLKQGCIGYTWNSHKGKL